MAPKQIIFLGSKPVGYECLAWMIGQRSRLNIDIIGLLTQTRKEFGGGHDLVALAQEHHIPVIASLDEMPECDILYSVQYHQVLKAHHIGKARQIAVNLHMAPLPEYRGSNQFSFAIIDQKKEFGTTLHVIDERIDHGDILFQSRFAIPAGCWVHDLYQLTYDASLTLFREYLEAIVNGAYHPLPQASLVAAYGSGIHYRKEMDEIKVIDLSWDEEKITRYVRATSMPGFEPPYCLVNGKKVYFTPES